MHYALSRLYDESPYHVYGKGDDPAEAEADAARNIEEAPAEEAAALRVNLVVMTREESEQRGYVVPGAPVIWYDYLRRYRVEDHGPYRPRGIERRLRHMLR
jgi:hypothetical protein